MYAFDWYLPPAPVKTVFAMVEQTEVTVTLELTVKDFRDGKAVFENELNTIKTLAAQQTIKESTIRQSYYTVDVNNYGYRLYGNIHFILEPDKAPAFVELLLSNGYQVRNDTVKRCG
jgi:hypothetical protein